MSSNFNNAKIINVYYNKGDRKPYDVNGKPIAYIGEEFVGSNESSEIRFFFGQDLDSATPIIITKRPDGQTYLDLCEKIGTGVNSYYRVFLNDWYAEVKGKLTIVFKVYNGSVTFNEGNTEILTASGQVIVSDIFNLEVGYAPLATSAVPPFDPSPETSWYFALSTKLDKAQSITVTGALPTLTGGVYDDRYFYVEDEGVGKLFYIDGSTAIEVVWGIGTLKLTSNGNEDINVGTNAGKMYWDSDRGTIIAGLYDDQEAGIGDSLFFFGKATEAIAKGEVVQFNGNTGGNINFKKAVFAQISAQPDLLMGVAKHAIPSGDFGYVVSFGYVRNLNTSGNNFSTTQPILYLSTTIAGQLTFVKPTTGFKGSIAAVARFSSGGGNDGFIIVRPNLVKGIGELADVTITTATSGQILSFDGSKWVNSTRLTTAESNITNLQGRMTTEEANVDNLQGRMTSAEGDIDDIESGATIVPRALGDQNGNTINTTYLTQSSASATYIPLSQKAQANGVATLGADGKVIPSQIPGIVSSVEEYDTLEDFPEVGVLTTVYLALDTGLTYLWSGSGYVALSSSLALGETSTTAYRGDRGKIAYDYSQVGHLPLAGGTITNDLTVGGNLTVSGTTTTVNTTEVNIKDNLILINSNQTGEPNDILKGGLEIERGDLTNFQFVFDESDDRFKVGQVGSLQTVATRTDDGTISNRGITFFNTSTNRLENNANVVIDTDNNVGIGTTSPNQLLEVKGSSTTYAKISSATATAFRGVGFGIENDSNIYGSLAFETQNGELRQTAGFSTFGGFQTFYTNGSERLRITSSGDIGIGTSTPNAKLQIATNDATSYERALKLGNGSSTNGSGAFIDFSGSTSDNLGSRIGGGRESSGHTFLKFDTLQSGNHSERMRITGAGNVGIGNNNPQQRLEVTAPDGSVNQRWSYGDAPTAYYLDLKQTVSSLNVRWNFSQRNNDTNFNDVLVFDKGNVGIGNNSPQTKLEVSADLTETARFSYSVAPTSYYLRLRQSSSGAGIIAWHFDTRSNDNQFDNNLVLDRGNVGIGTTNPAVPSGKGLVVFDDSIARVDLKNTATGLTGTDGSGIAVFENDFYIYNRENAKIFFDTQSSTRMTITGAGDVGIGTPSPAYKLDVNGSVAGNSAYVNKSDARLKQNIETITNGLDMVMKLRPVQYKWKKHPTLNFDLETTELGFTAQEVQQALIGTDYVDSVVQSTDVVIKNAEYEEVVKEDGTKERKLISEEVKEKYFNLAESKLVAILTKAIQELTKRIEELESK
jgi:hypothetical protein